MTPTTLLSGRQRRRAWLALAASLLAAPLAVAQAAYPQRAVTLVAPYPAGGASDVLARLLARKLEEQLGKPVVVDNRPGAGTTIGATHVANARPDGYTLFLSSNSTFSLNPAAGVKTSYDPATSFDAIGLVGTMPLAVVVHPSVPAQNVQQLVAAVRANPDKYPYGSFGNATSSHYAGAMFNQAAGLNMLHVPYKGSAPLMNDLIGGQVPVSFDSVVVAAPQREAGKVRVLAVTTAQRSHNLADVPTVAESGYPGFDFSVWMAVVGPKGLPAEVRQRLTQALQAVMQASDTQASMRKAGFEPQWQSVADWAKLVRDDIARMKTVAEQARIRIE
ncbi:MAG: tripartite tricarboxylate transporter substrate binding protein [Pseudomonadota bacterium]|nr:tripartite tricarboxylate transporter substrate binding protein [Pseudomonadota bacterium]